MAKRGLIFHPDDQSEDIVLADGTHLFTKHECTIIRHYIDKMFMHFGDQIYNVAVYVFMKIIKII